VSDITTCPRCHGSLKGAHVTERGLVCPHCANPLSDTGMGMLPAPSYPDVRRRTGTFVPFAVAVAVGFAFVALALLSEDWVLRAIALMFAFAYLDVVVVFALAFALSRWWNSQEWTKNVWAAALFVILILGMTAGVAIVMFGTCQGMLTLRGGLLLLGLT
jgi:hypothetical protein